MKRIMSTSLGMVLCASLAIIAYAQGNPRGTSKLMLNGTSVSVEYGRPSLHGRTAKELLAKLGTGEVWRLGADKSTTFKTTGGLSFGGTNVPAGEYSLWVKKEAEDKWSLVFNKQHGQWGTEHDPAQDLASVPLNVKTASKSAEEVTIALHKAAGGGEIVITWGDMELTANFTAA